MLVLKICRLDRSKVIAAALATGLKLLTYFAAVVLLGALAAPWSFWLGHAIGEAVHIPLLVLTDFKRYFERSILITAFILLLPALRWLGGFTFQDLGLQSNPHRGRQLAGGFLLAALLVFAYGWINIRLGLSHWKTDFPWTQVPQLLLTAFGVALVEELLFRGGLFGLLRKRLSPAVTALLVSLVYALVHLIRPDPTDPVKVEWYSGFVAVLGSLNQFADLRAGSGLLVTLFVLGLMLAHARMRTRSLWLSIGLHAGLVAAKMTFNKFTLHDAEFLPWFGPDLISGLGSAIFAAGCWLLAWCFLFGETPVKRDLGYSR